MTATAKSRRTYGALTLEQFARAQPASRWKRVLAWGKHSNLVVALIGAASFFAGTAWDGRDSEHLPFDKAIAIIEDVESSDNHVSNAAGRIAIIAKHSIQALDTAKRRGGAAASQVPVWLDTLDQLIATARKD